LKDIFLKKKWHFIGIGGISMSGLAQILLNQGCEVSGSDSCCSDTTRKLLRLGIKIYNGHAANNIQSPDYVAYTAAVKSDNPELLYARQQAIPCIERSELLGLLMEHYQYKIAVAGTHGKTSTTSMISSVILEDDKEPTIHVGGYLKSIDGGVRIGSTDFFITEACEYVDSFLKLHPTIAVILNLEYDHPDYFKDFQQMKESYSKFMQNISKEGYIVANIDDANVREVLNPQLGVSEIVTYALNNKAEWTAENIQLDEHGCAKYQLCHKSNSICEVTLNVPGLHNISNSVAAASTCYILGCKVESIVKGLKKFTGTSRRLELKADIKEVKLIDDYAHHPTEVSASLQALKASTKGKLWCVFQPHTYTRTKQLLPQFKNAFDIADRIIITDIYAAREKKRYDIHAEDLAKVVKTAGKDVIYMANFEDIAKHLASNVSAQDVIVTMGAGDVYKVGEVFLNSFSKG